ncbi:MAG: histidine kinase dimerization/phospho-acceptor domain-containing protein, partial [Butyricicoccaceae bacterium]
MKKSRLMRGVNVFSVIAIVVLWLVMFAIYTFFSTRILEREEETMVMTARTISNSMEQLIDEQENLLNVYFNRNHIWLFDEDITENIETILSESREQNGERSTDLIYISAETENILNFDGGLPHDIFDDIKEQKAALNKAKETDKAILAAWNRYDKNNYVLYLAKAVFVEDRCEGYVFEGIRLNEIYEIAMSEVELGAKANCKILDENSVIIMHTLPDQIGLNMLESLSDLPRKDRQTSRQAIQEEISGETGFSVNKAYWPDEPEWGSAEKIEAYTPVEVGDKRFYLILAAPRNDVMADVNQMLIYLMLLFFIFLLTGTLRILQLRARVRSEEHAREQLSYERELNETRQKLRAREDQDAKQDRLQTLGIMAGSMAHELNNAMTPILIYSDMLLDSYPEDQEIQEDVAQIRSSAQRCGELVHNLLIYGRQEKEEYKRQFYDVVPVFHNIISMLRQIKPDHVELRAVCALESAYLFGNAGAMRQIIVNLSTNAFYAMQEKGGVLDIFLGLSPENDSDLMLKV